VAFDASTSAITLFYLPDHPVAKLKRQANKVHPSASNPCSKGLPVDLCSLTESDICDQKITPAIQAAGWEPTTQIRREVTYTAGRIWVQGRMASRSKKRKRADYVLYFRAGIPLAVIEAKDANHTVGSGMQQALAYAEDLDAPFAVREAAKDESRRGLVWSGVAAIALIALSAVAFRTLWTYTNGTHSSGIDWSGFSIRLYTLFSLTALAYYAGRQGEIHRNAERQNRRLFSDLASVSPFLSDLETTKRQEIIEEIARRIFGQPETHTEPMKQSPFLSPDQLSKGWDVVIEAAGKTLKKL
jgi:hypothetical protein